MCYANYINTLPRTKQYPDKDFTISQIRKVACFRQRNTDWNLATQEILHDC